MFEEYRRKISRWVNDSLDLIQEQDPEDLPELNDRANDNWRPLLSIADVIGGEMPELARNAAKCLCQISEDRSVGIQLLEDMRTLFGVLDTPQLASSLTGKYPERARTLYHRGEI